MVSTQLFAPIRWNHLGRVGLYLMQHSVKGTESGGGGFSASGLNIEVSKSTVIYGKVWDKNGKQ